MAKIICYVLVEFVLLTSTKFYPTNCATFGLVFRSMVKMCSTVDPYLSEGLWTDPTNESHYKCLGLNIITLLTHFL